MQTKIQKKRNNNVDYFIFLKKSKKIQYEFRSYKNNYKKYIKINRVKFIWTIQIIYQILKK